MPAEPETQGPEQLEHLEERGGPREPQQAVATRPDRQPLRGNQEPDEDDIARGREKLDRVLTK